MKKKYDSPALVLDLFETGLAVGRSLGRNGIKVYGLDFKKDIGWYSKYIESQLCPHPINNENEFIEFLVSFSKSKGEKPVLFITSDDYLSTVSKSRNYLEQYYYINLPEDVLLEQITDKYKQYILAEKNSIPVPRTFKPESIEDIKLISSQNLFPYFIKALDVTSWRKEFGGSKKGFVANNEDELKKVLSEIINKGLKVIVQEIIPGADTNHYKYCTYISQKGESFLHFTLQKIRQFPIHFGVGSCVQSIEDPHLEKLGKKLFKSIKFHGVGSAEFKLDEREGKYKLIEINPRYWQQNSLAEKCGMNFPLVHYLDSIGEKVNESNHFKKGIKWVNLYMDLSSFLKYKSHGGLTFFKWIKSLRGEKVWSDFSTDDPRPGFYEILSWKKLFKIPKYLLKIFKGEKNER